MTDWKTNLKIIWLICRTVYFGVKYAVMGDPVYQSVLSEMFEVLKQGER